MVRSPQHFQNLHGPARVRVGRTRRIGRIALAAALGVPLLAGATNGRFSHGYGTQAEGSAGVGNALAQDSLAVATNPAGTAAPGSRLDLDLAGFRPAAQRRHRGQCLRARRQLAGAGHGAERGLPALQGQGLGVFAGFSSDPAHLIDQGTDTTTGVGLRLGWAGTVQPGLTLGARWASKIHGRFDKYRGLFADQGRFDVPENCGVGAAWAVTPSVTLAVDAQSIRYSRVAAVGDPVASLFAGLPLGSSGGPGFGRRDVAVLKTGLVQR
jgi:hypothetical protein